MFQLLNLCHHLFQCQPLASFLWNAFQSPHWLPNCPHLVRHHQLARQTWGTSLRGPQTFVLSSHSSSNLCLWTRGIRPGLIFITTPPWPPPHHHSNHQCALSLSKADTWPSPDGHWPAWPLNPAALNWNHSRNLPLPGLHCQTSCCDQRESKKKKKKRRGGGDDNVSA